MLLLKFPDICLIYATGYPFCRLFMELGLLDCLTFFVFFLFLSPFWGVIRIVVATKVLSFEGAIIRRTLQDKDPKLVALI